MGYPETSLKKAKETGEQNPFKLAALAIGFDIDDRRGIKNEWERIDHDIIAEDILPTWATIIETAVASDYDKLHSENQGLREEIERLKVELAFTREYLNPADTSFREMIDAFRVLPKEKQDKLIELSKALVGVQSGGGGKSCQK